MAQLNTMFDTSKPFLDNMIDECDVGDFKLTDAVFEQACNEYHITEEEAMQLMVNCKTGVFIRIEAGWIFTTN